jgi:transketolase
MNEPIKLKGRLRTKILEMHHKAHAGHIGSSLSCIDILITVLKFSKTAEDTFILSKGHAASGLYATLNELGEISDEKIESFYKNATTLPAHPAPLKYSSITFATGSLGHGLPIATGIAKAQKLKSEDRISYVLMSDGETNEGTTWEAAHFAVANKLDNLFIIIDKNGLQGFGNTKNILGDTASKNTWENIGFEVIEADGHDIALMTDIIARLKKNKNSLPKLIIANTAKGQGVGYMENLMEWHYLPMTETQYQQAIEEVRTRYEL